MKERQERAEVSESEGVEDAHIVKFEQDMVVLGSNGVFGARKWRNREEERGSEIKITTYLDMNKCWTPLGLNGLESKK
ncbi:hypothetical protein ACFXTH_037126 [Malus domestica]